MISRPQNVTLLTTALLLPGLLIAGGVSGHAADGDERKPQNRWEKTIQAFEKQDAENPPPKNGILFVGSSSIRYWDLKKSFPDRNAINRGFGGSEISDSIHFAQRIVLKHQPRIIVFYAGDNDIARGKSAKRVTTDWQQFVKIVSGDLPKTKILFVAIKPSIKRWALADEMIKANEAIRQTCDRDDSLVFIDVWKPMLGDDGKPKPELFIKDGLHMNAKGYALWNSLIRPHVKP